MRLQVKQHAMLNWTESSTGLPFIMSIWSQRFDPLPPDASGNVEMTFDSPWLGNSCSAGGQSLETRLEAFVA